ncbi:FkbM family methyltransferase [Roseinatronobacter sp.]|uniref:FkbM family methyltransferase n=1 Tax=Roseinatronobacter sp. TaxID=1945755 RepID=UPI0025F528AF|nr:FkbM family methyltransferase [Roseibaca sp.]
MKKVGEYWVPDVDTFWFKNLRKTKANYENGGHGTQLHHLTDAMTHIRVQVGDARMAASVAIDAGANVGAYARHLAGQFGHVHAFEPAQDTFDCLKRNVADWGLKDRITVHQKAVSDAPGGVSMGTPGLFRRSISREVSGTGDIPAVTLDSLEMTEVLFLKLDVEGYELKTLHGAHALLDRCKPFVMMEMKERKVAKGTADMAAHEFLIERGYAVSAKLGTPFVDWLYAPAHMSP